MMMVSSWLEEREREGALLSLPHSLSLSLFLSLSPGEARMSCHTVEYPGATNQER